MTVGQYTAGRPLLKIILIKTGDLKYSKEFFNAVDSVSQNKYLCTPFKYLPAISAVNNENGYKDS